QLLEALPAEQLGRRGGDERRERRRRHVRDLLEQRDVLRVVRELVVADQDAERLPAGHAELVLADLLEEPALVDLDRLGDELAQDAGGVRTLGVVAGFQALVEDGVEEGGLGDRRAGRGLLLCAFCHLRTPRSWSRRRCRSRPSAGRAGRSRSAPW